MKSIHPFKLLNGNKKCDNDTDDDANNDDNAKKAGRQHDPYVSACYAGDTKMALLYLP